MTAIECISLFNSILGFVALIAVAAARQKSLWVLGQAVVLGLMITVQITRLTDTDPTHAATIDVLDLIFSAASTYVLARTALFLLDATGLPLFAGLVATIFAQGINALAHIDSLSKHALLPYENIDVAFCAMAGAAYGVALYRRFDENKLFATIALLGAITWGGADMIYWLPKEDFPMVTSIGRWAMIAGLFVTNVMTALLAMRNPPATFPASAIAKGVSHHAHRDP